MYLIFLLSWFRHSLQDNVVPAGLKIDAEGACFTAGSDLDQLGTGVLC